MVEFISENKEEIEAEEPSLEQEAKDQLPEEEETSEEEQTGFLESLEEVVETQDTVVPEVQTKLDYFDEPSAEGEYFQPVEYQFENVLQLKEELTPLAYEDQEIGFVVDLFERYGKKDENNWWKHLRKY